MRFGIIARIIVVSSLIVSACSPDQPSGRMPVTTDSEHALELYESGMIAFDQIKFSLAYKDLEQAVKEDPDFFMAYFWIYFISWDKSKQVADQALNTHADLNDGEREIKTAFKYLLDGQNEKVVEHLNKAIALYPKDPDVHKILYILQYQYLKDVEGALKSVKRAIKDLPDYPLAYNQLGYAYLDLKMYDKAEDAFNTYLRLSPGIANPYDSKGDYYMATEQYAKAYDSYVKAYQTDSSFTVSAKKAKKAMELTGKDSPDQ
jgi:tetratricopeptide (TPR) repeat protein